MKILYQQLINKLIEGKKLPHLLLYGPPGTGKTSTILAVARKLYGNNFKQMTLELNASDERGIDVVRDKIKNFASTRIIFSSGFKLIILDEADAMTQAAQNALRRVIEKYSQNTRFCLICNYVSKIIPALQSRCTRFRFAPLQPTQIISRLKFVIEQEHIKYTEDGLDALMRLGAGDMRKCLNIMQSTWLAFAHITEKNVYLSTGNPLPEDIDAILNWLLNEPFEKTYNSILKLKTEKGLALLDIIREIYLRIGFGMDSQTREGMSGFPAEVKMYLIDKLSESEHRLAFGTNEKIQLSAVVGYFTLARDRITALIKQKK